MITIPPFFGEQSLFDDVLFDWVRDLICIHEGFQRSTVSTFGHRISWVVLAPDQGNISNNSVFFRILLWMQCRSEVVSPWYICYQF
jgi:hypothetical protein